MTELMDDELLFRSAMGQCNKGEEASVAGWRRLSPENEAHFRDLVDALFLTAEVDDAQRFRRPPASGELLGVVRGAGMRMRQRRTPSTITGQSKGSKAGWGRFIRAAAVIAAIAVALPLVRSFVRFDSGGNLRSSNRLGPDEFTTEAEPATVGLGDGTLVRMAPESRLRVHPRDGTREVSLTGRGYFAVARDPSRIFRIQSDAGTVTVLGTRFDLTINGEDLRVIVIEGTVGLTVRGSMVDVEAGQMAEVVNGNLIPPVEVPDPQSLLDWVGDFVAFQETPLRTVAVEVERRHGVRMEFSDPGLGRRTVTAWFAGRTFDEMAEVICMVTHLRCTQVDDVLRMTPAPRER